MGNSVLGSFKGYLPFQEKWFWICWSNLAFSILLPILNGSEGSTEAFDSLQNKLIGNSNVR